MMPSVADLLGVLPEMIVVTAACLVLVLDPITAPSRKDTLAWLSLAALAICCGITAAHLDGRTLLFRTQLQSVNPAAIPFDPTTERAGEPLVLLTRTGVLMPSSVSPDGAWIAMGNQGERQEDLFLMRRDGTDLRRLTDDAARDRAAHGQSAARGDTGDGDTGVGRDRQGISNRPGDDVPDDVLRRVFQLLNEADAALPDMGAYQDKVDEATALLQQYLPEDVLAEVSASIPASSAPTPTTGDE